MHVLKLRDGQIGRQGFEILEWAGGTVFKLGWDRWEAVRVDIYNKQLLNILKMDVKELRYVGQRSNAFCCESICCIVLPGNFLSECYFEFLLPFLIPSFWRPLVPVMSLPLLSFQSVFNFFCHSVISWLFDLCTLLEADSHSHGLCVHYSLRLALLSLKENPEQQQH